MNSELTKKEQYMEADDKLSYPTVTVGIPFHDDVDIFHLQQSIDSIINQSLPPQVIHLIQDGPVSDQHNELVLGYIRDHDNIQHLVIKENSGLPYAVNLSIINCNTTYYARMDSDDIAHPNRLKQQIDFLESNDNVDILGTWAYEFDDDDQLDQAPIKKVPTTSKTIFEWSHYRNPIIHPSVIFRYSVFAKLGLYDTKIKTGARDLALWIRALQSGINIVNLPTPLIYYRCGDDVIKRRARFDRVLMQAAVRFGYPTLSPRLNFLKLSAIIFRLLPLSIQRYGYKIKNR